MYLAVSVRQGDCYSHRDVSNTLGPILEASLKSGSGPLSKKVAYYYPNGM